jgi:hypothetical protein
MNNMNNYNSKKEEDTLFGCESEKIIREQLNEYFKINLAHTEDKMCVFDFYDNDKNIFVELKTRRCYSYTYNTTMIGYNKIRHCKKNLNNDYYFVFKFINALYYIKYDDNIFGKFMIKKSGRDDRGYSERSDYIYIPLNLLIKID